MSINKKYRLTIEDEASLQKKVDVSTRVSVIFGVIIGVLILGCAIGMLVMAYSPLKKQLPGYLKESERTATEEQHLRLDSLTREYEINEAYITSILNALDPPETMQRDTMRSHAVALTLDSLMPTSEEERSFMEEIRERDKYNVTYTSSAAAETMMFGSVNSSGIVTEQTKDQRQAEIIIPEGEPITTIAEGKVISVASSPKYSGAYEVIIQHPKGFLSKTGRLSNLIVRPGDHVTNGQVIATATTKNGMKGNHVSLELWHDGDPLVPSRYIR